MKSFSRYIALAGVVTSAACAPKIRPLERVMDNGQVLAPAGGTL